MRCCCVQTGSQGLVQVCITAACIAAAVSRQWMKGNVKVKREMIGCDVKR